MAALLREALIDHFHALKRPIVAHRPITVLGVNNILQEALPSDPSVPPWFVLLPRYELDVRLFFLANQEPSLALPLVLQIAAASPPLAKKSLLPESNSADSMLAA